MIRLSIALCVKQMGGRLFVSTKACFPTFFILSVCVQFVCVYVFVVSLFDAC